MRRISCGLIATLAVIIGGCGKDAPLRPSDQVPARSARLVAGGVSSAQLQADLPIMIDGNPTAPGLVQLAPIGNPTWKPADFHVFSAPIGTASSGYAEFGNTILGLLPPPNHVPNPSLGVGPGAPHAPPYNTELANGVTNLGYHEDHAFNVGQFSNGNGVFCVWMNIPNPGTTGSSPDFASGPIIANGLFPIHVAGTSFRNGQVWDPFIGTFDVPALNAIDPPFNVDGTSHFPVFFADNLDFAPPNTNAIGAYTYRFRMTDTGGNGWDISASFTISSTGGGGSRQTD